MSELFQQAMRIFQCVIRPEHRSCHILYQSALLVAMYRS